jgi:sugar/nucleoside kinase (ribokinase family)
MSKEFHVCGLGNCLVDILLEMSEEEFAPLGFEKGTMRLVEPPEQKALLEKFRHREPRLVSGGSVANSIIACSQLGGRGAFLGCVGDDRYGLHYATEFEELQIEFCTTLVGETTERASASSRPMPNGPCDQPRRLQSPRRPSRSRHMSGASEWLFVEGYVFANPNTGQHAIRERCEPPAHGVKVAVTCPTPSYPRPRQRLQRALKQTDLHSATRRRPCPSRAATRRLRRSAA